MVDNQSHVIRLREIQRATFMILSRLKDAGAEETQAALQEYVALVDRFREISEHVAPQQYKAAKDDAEYFLRLLDLAIEYFETDDQE